jgi:CheY-like chemotaxis protein
MDPKPKPTIALVEDEPLSRQVLGFHLRHLGYQVHDFADASGFYAHLETQPVSIALLDIGLPDEDGISICKKLRAKDQHMGIVFITGKTQRNDRLDGLEAGADAFLAKPNFETSFDAIWVIQKTSYKTNASVWRFRSSACSARDSAAAAACSTKAAFCCVASSIWVMARETC